MLCCSRSINYRMENSVIIRIAVLGGKNSGKSSILRRLYELSEFNYLFRHNYGFINDELIDTKNLYDCHIDFHDVNVIQFNALLTTNLNLNIQVCEMNVQDINDPNTKKFEDIDGSLLLIDCSNIESLKDADNILSHLRNKNESIPTYLLVNKADNNTHVVNPNTLDVFIRSTQSLINWAYTVGISEFGDFDFKRGRGRWSYQKAPDEIFFIVVRNILEKRKIPGNLICKSFLFNSFC